MTTAAATTTAATAVIADIERLLPLAHRATSKAMLEAELARQKQILSTAAAASAPPAMPAAPLPAAPPPLPSKIASEPATSTGGPTFKPIVKYMFDQSAKFVKVYITLPGIEDVPDASVRLDVHGGGALTFEVLGLPATSPHSPNARLAVHVLHSRVEPSACSWTRKADSMVLLKLRKAAEGQEWGSLDDSAIVKAKRKEKDLEENKGKSTQELLSKMYAEADEEGKASLAAAWENGREAREGRKKVS